jgi:hypothetical protein
LVQLRALSPELLGLLRAARSLALRLVPPMICPDRVIRVLPHGVQRRRDQLVEDPRVDRGTVGVDLGRDRARAQRPGKEAPGGRQVTPPGKQDIDGLAMLVDRPAQAGQFAGDLHAHLTGNHRSPGAWRHGLAAPGELRSEALDPPADGDVIHGDSALGQQFPASR